MKIKCLVTLLAVMLSLHGMACDLCNLYLSLNPQFNNNQAGLRMRLRTAAGPHGDSHAHASGHDHSGLTVYDTYLSMEAYSRLYFGPKWVGFLTVPYALNTQRDSGGDVVQLQGLGDVPLLIQRQLFNVSKCDTCVSGHRLFAGGGLKVPVGEFDFARHADPHLQTGTGSWDVLMVGAYMARMQNWGLAADCNFRISTANRQGYRFANRFNSTASLFYSWMKGPWTLMPNAGGYMEMARLDLYKGVYQTSTGGLSVFGTAGMEVYWKRFALTATAQLPVFQRLNGTQPGNRLRMIGSVGVSF